MLKQKIQKVQSHIRSQKSDGVFVINPSHQIHDDLLYYLLLTHLELGAIFIPKKGKPILWAIPFETKQLKKAYPEISVKPYDKKLSELLSTYSTKQIWRIRESALPVSALKQLRKLKNIKLAPLSQDELIYAEKLPDEIKLLQKAANITDELFAELIANWKTFKKESDATSFLLTEMARRGIEPSFPPIVASGKNAANPHHNTYSGKLQKGFCVIDMGVRYKGYCSDMTRTIFIGKPTEKQRAFYTHIQNIQQNTVEMVRPGVTVADIDTFCRSELGPELNKQFIHSLGHGLGSQVHEWPRVSSHVDLKLKPNMYITIEPGVYKHGSYGIRIEDDVLVTEKGYKVLNKTAKDLIIVN